MEFEWDPRKATINLTKHGVSFEEAATVFDDPFAVDQYDLQSETEDRSLRIGMSQKLRVLLVVYTIRSGDKLRLISARKATQRETRIYQDMHHG